MFTPVWQLLEIFPDTEIVLQWFIYLFQIPYDVFEFLTLRVVWTALGLIYPQLFVSILFGALTSKLEDVQNIFHCTSWFIGMIYLFLYEYYHFQVLLFLVLFSYMFFIVAHFWMIGIDSIYQVSSIYGFLSISAFIYLEINDGVENFNWKRYRYMLMIALMKIYSVSVNLSSNNPVPPFCQYMGYMFCPATLLLGPYMTINDYNDLCYTYKINVWSSDRFKRIVVCTFQTIACCMVKDFADSYFTDHSNKYFSAFLKCISFRFECYAYGFAVEALMVGAGFKTDKTWKFQNVSVTTVEWPRCFTHVWIGMDLSIYTFVHNQGFFLIPNYIVFSLFASSYTILLADVPNMSGLVFKLCTITFTYMFYKFREVFSEFTSTCTRSQECMFCYHNYKKELYCVIVINTMFTIVVMALMPYVFILIDNKAYTNDVNFLVRWRHFNYFGHHILIIISIITTLLSDAADLDDSD